ncbi:pilin [Photobacterium iliopiscarium]|uniref:pilin n=1 Tax=Photobacterium iliopiscarium TaxID=56192 RepID=UPI001E349FE9|nr:pilin [Photobacterium iliopiscarium]MCD9486089.1 prepilin-type N-terminal cleavage/methylation domain-containing protein [Photobacterium iliopiscarium]MCF2242726.1 prepilin-type N-terminal cleavage/methylation domain-containing protein [Photobacterium iliopiscarium]
MKKQQGFTLIELMIVVAVIGVLSAIAIPQYQKYVAKAEVASVLSTMTGIKTNLEAFIVENGRFPTGKTGEEPVDLGAPKVMPLGEFSLEPGTKDAGTLNLEFGDTNVNALLQGSNLTLAREAKTGTWTCTSADIEKALLPKGCTSTLIAS